MNKPFRPPLLKKVDNPTAINSTYGEEPHTKRRRISSNQEDENKPARPQLGFKKPGISSLPRKPLLAVENPSVAARAIQPLDGGVEGYYNVLWYVLYCYS